MTPPKNVPPLLEALKRHARARGMSYPRLAKALGVSLPTIKRALNSPDIPLSRLDAVCDAVGIELRELVQEVSEARPPGYRLTRKQEEFFAANLHYLAYFLALRTGKSPELIAREHGLSAAQTRKLLSGLERIGLILRVSKDRITQRVKERILLWDDDGILGREVSRDQIMGLAERATRRLAKKDPHLFVDLSGRMLTEGQYREFQAEVSRLREKVARDSARNPGPRDGSTGAAKYYTIMVIADAWDAEVFSRIRAP